jgi:hypothetical protein
MLKNKKSPLTVAAFALVLTQAGFAQDLMRHQMPNVPSEMPEMGMMRMMAECPMMMGGDMATHAQGRIAFLKAELAITDAQKAHWDAYATALTQNFQAMQGTRQAMMKVMEAKSPVERLDNQIAAMEGRVAALKEIKPSLAKLYSALSEEQKQKANELMTGMGCMM